MKTDSGGGAESWPIWRLEAGVLGPGRGGEGAGEETAPYLRQGWDRD